LLFIYFVLDTVQDADGKVRIDDGSGAKQISGTLTLLLCAVFVAFRFKME